MQKLTQNDVRGLLERCDDPLAILQECGGYYECPKDSQGNRLGPLVGYAGTYAPGMHYVGDVYANFAAAEQYLLVMHHFAKMLRPDARLIPTVDVVCGAPIGGLSIATMIGLVYGYRYTYMEKKVTMLATPYARERSELVFGRHEIVADERIIIAEDVSNNFSTTAQMIALIHERGGRVMAITSLLNRSLTVDDEYDYDGCKIPVLSLVRKKIGQYRQDDPAVAADVEKRNVVWKPKHEQSRLVKAMARG